MRRLTFVIIVLCANWSFGQDPTVPSQAMLSRLRSGSVVAETTQPKPPSPTFKLRAMVFLDDNHGTAIVEADGRKFYLNLNRATLNLVAKSQTNEKHQVGIQIGESLYRLIDFSASSIVLSNGTQEVLVQ